MTERLSLGPIQISDVSPISINDALRELQERIDKLVGLRGDLTVFSAVTIDRVKHGTDIITYTDSNGTVLHGMGNV